MSNMFTVKSELRVNLCATLQFRDSKRMSKEWQGFREYLGKLAHGTGLQLQSPNPSALVPTPPSGLAIFFPNFETAK